MAEPNWKDYRGIESGGSHDDIHRDKLTRDIRDGLHRVTSSYRDFKPESGLCHQKDASFFWVRDSIGRLLRVRVTAEIEEQE